MSVFRIQSARILRSRTTFVPSTTTTTRAFSLTRPAFAQIDPDTLAKEKARNLSGTQDSSAPHKEHAPGWNEHLASDSEAAVKADQAAPEGKPGKDMQDATVAHTHKHHHTDEGHKGAEHHHAKHNPVRTDSEDSVKADRGEH